MIVIPQTMSKSEFNFEPGQYQRFERIVLRPTGPMILNELRDLLIEAGADADIFSNLVPRSVYRPEMLDEPLTHFFNLSGDDRWNPDNEAYCRAMIEVRRKYKVLRPVKRMRLEEVVQRMDLSRNAGLPTLGPKAEDVERALLAAQQCERGKSPPPSVVMHRGKNLQVARAVHCLPFEWHIVEGSFFYPLQDAILSFNNPYYVGRTRAAVSAKINEMCGHATRMLCLDYSQFDASLNRRIIAHAFSVLEKSLQLDEREAKLWRRLATYFVTCPMLCPDGYVYYGRRGGVPSGSMFTQLIDSVCNSIIIEYVAARLKKRFGHHLVVGDDSVIQVNGVPPLLTRVAAVIGELGVNVNVEKSKYYMPLPKNVHFLGHYGTSVATRPVEETYTRMVTPERYIQGLFSKDISQRYQAYAMIVRGHIIDNQAAFGVLERVLEVVEGYRKKVYVGDTRLIYKAANRTTDMSKVNAQFGRTRWDVAFRERSRRSVGKGAVAGVLMMT